MSNDNDSNSDSNVSITDTDTYTDADTIEANKNSKNISQLMNKSYSYPSQEDPDITYKLMILHVSKLILLLIYKEFLMLF